MADIITETGAPHPLLVRPDAAQVGVALEKLQGVRDDLEITLLSRDEQIKAALVALLAAEHYLQIGPPGTAKTLLMTEIARRVRQPDGSGLRTFVAQFNKYTRREDLYGPVSVAALRADEYRHVIGGTAADCHLALFDELYKGGPNILNSLLLLLNERQFINGAEVVDVPLITAFCSSNEPPTEGEGLAALHDRLMVRQQVEYLDADPFKVMISQAAKTFQHRLAAQHAALLTRTTGAPVSVPRREPAHILSLEELFVLQRAVMWVQFPPVVTGQLETLRRTLLDKGIVVSDRRWAGQVAVLKAHALLRGQPCVDDDDLLFLSYTLWHKPSDIEEIKKQVKRVSNPALARISEIVDGAYAVQKSFVSAHQSAKDELARQQVVADAMGKLKAARESLKPLVASAEAQQASFLSRARKAQADVQSWMELVVTTATGG